MINVIPIPIPIFNSNIEYNNTSLIALWLSLNLFFIIYFLIRMILYPFLKYKIKWTKKWFILL